MIGVDDIVLGIKHLKRSILFFDEMVLVNASSKIEEWRDDPEVYRPEAIDQANELEYLLSTPYFQDHPFGEYDVGWLTPVGHQGFDDLRNDVNKVMRQIPRLMKKSTRKPSKPMTAEERIRPVYQISDLFLRVEVAFQESLGRSAISAREFHSQESFSGITSQTSVLQLAIEKVPIPDDSTPWEAILELKTDQDLSDRARKLRIWALDTARAETSLRIVEERLADSLSDYEGYLRAHKIKFVAGVMRSAIVGSAEFLEDVLKIRLGKLSSRLLSAKQIKAEMTLSEIAAPGRAVSLVTKLNSKLDGA